MDVDEEEVEVSRVRGNKRPQRGHGAYKIRHLIVSLSLTHSLRLWAMVSSAFDYEVDRVCLWRWLRLCCYVSDSVSGLLNLAGS